ncbi:MAG: pyridoxal phosphate-dependent aminotransferase [Myxococcales bacterium]|nr:pyridoxal phosphate-dependent aminotransferase [Myxococcales bacterium]
MFARRTAWDLTPTELAERVACRRAEGRLVVDGVDTNPGRCGILRPGEILREGLDRLARDPRALRYEPDPRGDLDVREALAGLYADTGRSLGADRSILTAGTSEAYAHLFRLLADPGDRIHLPSPGYGLFAHLAELEGLEVASYPLREPGPGRGARWRLDLDALAADLDERSRVIVTIDPHNPTGSFVDPADLASLASIAEERGLALITDEVFTDYATEGHARPGPSELGDAGPLRFVLSGASKVLGLPQIKVAWIGVEGPPALRNDALARLEFVADAFLSVSPLAASLMPFLLAHRDEIQTEIRARLSANRAALAGRVAAWEGVELLPAEAGWHAILRVRRPAPAAPDRPRSLDEEAFVLALLDRTGVLVHPGGLYDLEPRDRSGRPCEHLVLSLLIEPDRLSRVADGLEPLLAETSAGLDAPSLRASDEPSV